jgi:hypothetical protein
VTKSDRRSKKWAVRLAKSITLSAKRGHLDIDRLAPLLKKMRMPRLLVENWQQIAAACDRQRRESLVDLSC